MAEDGGSETLIEQAVLGNRRALEELLLDYHDDLARDVASRLPADLQAVIDVDDILHATYLKVFIGIAHCRARSKSAFRAWVRTIAHNQLADARKHRRHERREAVPHGTEGTGTADLANCVAASGSTPSGKLQRAESVRAVQAALASLPEAYRQAIWLRYFHGLSVQETAAVMGRSPGSIRGLCQRAREALRAILDRQSSKKKGGA